MIPASTTLTREGRAIRSRLRWATGAVLGIVALTFLFSMLDRSTVVEGPAGSSFATNATGLAALHDVLERAGRAPIRVQQPVTGEVLTGVTTFLAADLGFVGYEPTEVEAIVDHVTDGGSVVLFGQPPSSILDAFGIEVSWRGTTLGRVPGPDDTTLAASRFGSFAPDHAGTTLAGTDRGDLAVSFPHGAGAVVLVADSSVAHDDTIDQGDNIVFLGHLLDGVTAFDEYRHGYDATTATSLLSSAPGNWAGAALVGAAVLALILVSYGRRFGSPEPAVRHLAPDRGAFIDSVSRRLRRTGDPIPTGPIRTALVRELRLPADASDAAIIDRAAAAGSIAPADPEFVHDHLLAQMLIRKDPPT